MQPDCSPTLSLEALVALKYLLLLAFHDLYLNIEHVACFLSCHNIYARNKQGHDV